VGVAVIAHDAVFHLPPDRPRGTVVVKIIAGLEEIDLGAGRNARIDLDPELHRYVQPIDSEIEVEGSSIMEAVGQRLWKVGLCHGRNAYGRAARHIARRDRNV
jgi:hypothetical protein